jgi:hypothetical protein
MSEKTFSRYCPFTGVCMPCSPRYRWHTGHDPPVPGYAWRSDRQLSADGGQRGVTWSVPGGQQHSHLPHRHRTNSTHLGYSNFTTWWDSSSKRCQKIFLNMVAKKGFQLVKPFLANLPYTIYFFFYHMSIKKRRILRWFQIRGNNWKKVHPDKVIW